MIGVCVVLATVVCPVRQLSFQAATPSSLAPVQRWESQQVLLTACHCAGFYVRILRTNISNPVVNIRVVPLTMEATYASTPYQPRFLEQVSGECWL